MQEPPRDCNLESSKKAILPSKFDVFLVRLYENYELSKESP